MSIILEPFRRVLESRVEGIILRHLSHVSPLTRLFIQEAFPGAEALAIESAIPHVHRDHRRAGGNPLAYGETDIEVIASVEMRDGTTPRVGLLIEAKVDARQMDQQGPRYKARAEYRQASASWDAFRCILTAPRGYLENAYPLGDHNDDGWNCLLAIEDIAKVLARIPEGRADAAVLYQAAEPSNAWNKPLPGVLKFWSDLAGFQRAIYPDVPIFINRQHGAGLSIWPSFYENHLARNSKEIRRKRVQVVHSGKTHVALYVKNVRFLDFATVVQPMLIDGIGLGPPGQSWQSVRIDVPYVDPQRSVEGQAKALAAVFEAARRLFDFFIEHEGPLLSVPTFK
ncbi:hypothetical protein [Mesorhizobium sp. WSM3879]|uniref:hypothetical protein n=1 Tax=Mesorhizobium sp. WSM3879 TaxID=2029406 RepID=UPI001180F6C9|nr:hypothetical protein [Mesorhizobium sp. WSM3879]